ncbi:MAG: hypothetical protein IPO92_09005 [Saprospiraceae bacterium]|nr:hypothetical protein [Saprospiraceae bacterium]
MKNFIVFAISMICHLTLSSQNVGINNTDPQVSLDISGALAHRSLVVQPFLNNVNVPPNVTFLVIENTGGYSGDINIVDAENRVDGRRLLISNNTGYNATFNGSTLVPNETKEFVCKAPLGGWKIITDSSTDNISWSLTGNAGTNPASNFIGTNDNNPLSFRTNQVERMDLTRDVMKTKLSLKTTDIFDTLQLAFTNRNSMNEGIDFHMASQLTNQIPGLTFSSKSSLNLFNTKNILTMTPFGDVGVATNTPGSKFQVNHRAASYYPSISIVDSSTTETSGGILQFRNVDNTNNFNIESLLGNSPSKTYLNFSSEGFYLMRLTGSGNLGIGILDPTSKLDVNGDVGIRNSNKLEFGKGILGKEANAGTIGYKRFSDALDIIGAGNNTDLTDRKVKIWAEGGSTLTGKLDILGDVNTTGKIKVNGNAGTSGQVLTSNGPSSSPSWQSPATTTPVRFAATFLNSVAPYNDIIYTTSYNTSPSDVTIGTSIITINKTGLYRLSGSLNSVLNFTGGVPYTVYFGATIYADGIPYLLAQDNPPLHPLLLDFPVIERYLNTYQYSYDIYLTAPATINLVIDQSFYSGTSGATFMSREKSGVVLGYLISE